MAARTNGRDAMTALARASAGVACLARVVGDAVPDLQRIAGLPGLPTPTLWLGMHRDARETPRLRTVAGYLAQQLRGLEGELCPA